MQGGDDSEDEWTGNDAPRGPLAPHPSWAASPARGMPARAPAPEQAPPEALGRLRL